MVEDEHTSPVFEKGYPSYDAVNRESYHDYMGRRMREEDAKMQKENALNKKLCKIDPLLLGKEETEKYILVCLLIFINLFFH